MAGLEPIEIRLTADTIEEVATLVDRWFEGCDVTVERSTPGAPNVTGPYGGTEVGSNALQTNALKIMVGYWWWLNLHESTILSFRGDGSLYVETTRHRDVFTLNFTKQQPA